MRTEYCSFTVHLLLVALGMEQGLQQICRSVG